MTRLSSRSVTHWFQMAVTGCSPGGCVGRTVGVVELVKTSGVAVGRGVKGTGVGTRTPGVAVGGGGGGGGVGRTGGGVLTEPTEILRSTSLAWPRPTVAVARTAPKPLRIALTSYLPGGIFEKRNLPSDPETVVLVPVRFGPDISMVQPGSAAPS